MKYVVTQNSDSTKVYGPSSWTARLAGFMGLTGNAAPTAPFDNGEHTLREVVTDRAVLLDYQEAQADAGALDGDVWRVTETAVDMPLDQAVNRAKADVDQRQAAALNGGIDVDGTVVDVTIDARTQVAEVQSRGGEQKLVTRRGQAVILTPESCVSTIAAIDAHRSAAAERAYDLYVAVDAAADLDALRAIDIAVGWPPTVEEDLT